MSNKAWTCANKTGTPGSNNSCERYIDACRRVHLFHILNKAMLNSIIAPDVQSLQP